VIDAGHQGTERIMADYLRDLLNQESKKQEMEIEAVSFNGRECIITI
jgi:putative NIF3 family GTP cyclohydrolase 1 type 2